MIKKYVFVISLIFIGITKLFSQEIDSTKVLMSKISRSYKGETKDGLADGKGTAIGEDTYTGGFKTGLPDGKGKYTYKNGNTYTGFWSNGQKNGKGVFNYSINGTNFTQKGYWVNGDYSGLDNPNNFYNVSNMIYIESYTINKLEGNENNILLSVMNGEIKYVPSNFDIKISSGQWQSRGKDLFINNYTYPINCEIHFTIRIGGLLRSCYFFFDILKAGKYEVVIHTS